MREKMTTSSVLSRMGDTSQIIMIVSQQREDTLLGLSTGLRDTLMIKTQMRVNLIKMLRSKRQPVSGRVSLP